MTDRLRKIMRYQLLFIVMILSAAANVYMGVNHIDVALLLFNSILSIIGSIGLLVILYLLGSGVGKGNNNGNG